MNVLYGYPKSSCSCYGKPKDTYQDTNDIRYKPTSLGVTNCTAKNYSSKPFLQYNIRDINDTDYHYLNSKVISDEKEFVPDVRLIDTARSGTVLVLDRPPTQTDVNVGEVDRNDDLTKYGKNYSSYSDIDGGQILYYHQTARPFANPNFPSDAEVTGYMYTNPMGSVKPRYHREPKYKNNTITKDQLFSGGLSYIDDTSRFREDILSKQMTKMNEQDWDVRWSSEY
jgi:hypothetical protein